MAEIEQDSAPDIESSSDGYASRFSGAVGRFLLEHQERVVMTLIDKNIGIAPLRVLDVGGGHGQLTEALLRAGHTVVLQGSDEVCFARTKYLQQKYPDRLTFVKSPILDIPVQNCSFDLVLAIRLIAHVVQWKELIKEMTRISKRYVIIDFAPKNSFNFFYKTLFKYKKKLEGNTRTFLRHSIKELDEPFKQNRFAIKKSVPEFFIPLVVHRTANMPRLSACFEFLFLVIGLTQKLGSPIIVLAEKIEGFPL